MKTSNKKFAFETMKYIREITEILIKDNSDLDKEMTEQVLYTFYIESADKIAPIQNEFVKKFQELANGKK
jgi:hypothetical protein